jgi:hypothetical protein
MLKTDFRLDISMHGLQMHKSAYETKCAVYIPDV